MIKIGLERIDTQKGVTVEALLDSKAMRLVISLEFARKQEFKLKKIENPIYVRNVDGTFNKKEPIENIVKVNIYYQGYGERTEIDVIGGQIEYDFRNAVACMSQSQNQLENRRSKINKVSKEM